MNGKKSIIVSTLLALVFVIMCAFACIPGEGLYVQRGDVDKARILQGEDDPADTRAQLLPGDMVDINTADAETLALLPGIGPVLAGEILRYRQENGAFETIGDIMKVEGIGQGRFEELAQWIYTGEMNEDTGR